MTLKEFTHLVLLPMMFGVVFVLLSGTGFYFLFQKHDGNQNAALDKGTIVILTAGDTCPQGDDWRALGAVDLTLTASQQSVLSAIAPTNDIAHVACVRTTEIGGRS